MRTQLWWHGGGLPSGPYAVYSVRKAVPTYSGNAFQMARDSDGSTLNLGFVGDEYDTASAITFASGTTGRVKSLYDQSGNGRDIATGGWLTNPIIVSGGVAFTRGGKLAWNWNSETQQFNLPAAMGTSAFTVGVVAYNTTTGGSPRTLVGGVFAGAPQLLVANVPPASIYLNRQNQAVLITSSLSVSVGLHTFLLCGGTSASDQIVGLDGSEQTGGGTGSYTQGLRALGMKTDTATEIWNDGITKFIFYDRILSAAERAALQANQKAYFGTP